MNNYCLDLSKSLQNKEIFDFYFDAAYQAVEQLGQDYPGFKHWYHNKVKAGVQLGEREVILSIIDDYLAGLAVLKRTETERKICTIRVLDPFQGRGLGRKLTLKSFEFLDTEKPLITINSEKHYQFKRMFSYFGFKKHSELNGYYLTNQTEVTYNGYL